MKTLFLCGREVAYPLNQTLLHSFQQFSQVDVIDENGSGKSILMRSARVFLKALPKLFTEKYDLIFVGFFGHFIMLSIRLFTSVPVLFHPFISTYETLVFDRKITSQNSIFAKLAFILDRTACRAADHILLDTQANVAYFSSLFKIPTSKFHVIFMGADEKLFQPRSHSQNGDPHIVLYHGSYLPLQGIDTVIGAAHLLQNRKDIRFRLLGYGLEYERINKLVSDLSLPNIEFCPPVSLDQLPEQIAQASICLGGHFGNSEKAARVIAGKTFQDIAMGKATIVGDNSANRELFTHKIDAWLCSMNDSKALAQAVSSLVDLPELRNQIETNARQTFLRAASLKVLDPQVQQLALIACKKQ